MKSCNLDPIETVQNATATPKDRILLFESIEIPIALNLVEHPRYSYLPTFPWISSHGVDPSQSEAEQLLVWCLGRYDLL